MTEQNLADLQCQVAMAGGKVHVIVCAAAGVASSLDALTNNSLT